jgi:hypothetical protein
MEGMTVTHARLQGLHQYCRLVASLLAFGKNTGLKTLNLGGAFGSMDESLSTAMQIGLGMNETLESLKLNHVRLCGQYTSTEW